MEPGKLPARHHPHHHTIMGDKSPKSKQKNQSQRQGKADASAKAKQKQADDKQGAFAKANPKKK